jgi:hypothetical protein
VQRKYPVQLSSSAQKRTSTDVVLARLVGLGYSRTLTSLTIPSAIARSAVAAYSGVVV